MTLARTALRLITVAAIRGATTAGARVYDSRIDDLAPDVFGDDAKPTIIVTTDEDKGDGLSDQDGGPPFLRAVELCFQIGMLQRVKVEGDPATIGADEYDLIYPETDAQLEAALDLIEHQIARRLGSEPEDELCVKWRKVARKVIKFDSHRQIVDEAGQRLAVRLMTFTCEMADDYSRAYNYVIDAEPTSYARLPWPLSEVAPLMPVGSAMKATCDLLVSQIVPLEVENLEGVDIIAEPVELEAGEAEDEMISFSAELSSALDVPINYATSSEVEINYARGFFQKLILQANVTSITIRNWPRIGRTGRLILQIEQTGNFTIAPEAWQNTQWPNGGGDFPVITLGAGAIDLVVLATVNNGTNVLGNLIGQEYGAP
jgi:hypothetical protein